MRGLYLNTQSDNLIHCRQFFSQNSQKLQATLGDNTLEILYSPFEWTEGPPMAEVNGQQFFCAGWFIYKDKKNDLTMLAQDYLNLGPKILADIELGIFVILRFDGQQIELINDKIGLSTHYMRSTKGKLEVAPALKAFNQLGEPNQVMVDALNQQTHLFGNFTIYSDISRLELASCITLENQSKPYWLPDFKHADKDNLHLIPERIAKLGKYWPESKRSLAISGGLDSRLALVGLRFEFGYTYGPENSGDRPVARLFADCFNRYDEYDYTAPPLLPEEKMVCDEMFYGVSTYAGRLLTAYKYSYDLANGADGFFDGYCGDVYQRGNYLKFRQVLGNLFRLFPVFYRLGLSAEYLLRRRYFALGKAQLEILLADFHKRTKDFADANEYQKLIYYEQLYGRGGRYAINGGLITAGQMFTSIPFFFQKEILDAMFALDFGKAVEYRLLKPMWRDVPGKFSDVISDAGVGPKNPYWTIPMRNIFYRALVKYMPGYGTYVNEKQKK